MPSSAQCPSRSPSVATLKRMTDISVLTPSYGYGRYIEDAIESVRRQDGVVVEHIVQDGGSNDGTVDLLRRFDGLVWTSEPDRGQSDALNKALAKATGRWIGWLNADEFYLPRSLAVLIRHAERVGADVVYGDCIFVDADGRFERLLPGHRFSGKVLREYGCYIGSCALAIRRLILDDAPWDPSLERIMDWDLYLRLLRRGARFSHVAYPAGAFRRHSQSVTLTPPESDEEWNEVASRNGLPKDAAGRQRASRLGTWLHPFYKAVEGAYLREWRAHSLRGRDTRWFAGRQAEEACEALIRRS